MEHKVTLGLNTPNKETAIKVAEALIDIRNSLKSDEELFELRKILKEKPGLVKLARQFLGLK